MVGVQEAFLAVAVIIFIGYFGLIFFKKTKVSEILLLLGIGLLIGPVFGLLGPAEISLFEGFLPFFASFALMVILFEGGMQLNFFQTIKSLPGAFMFTIIIFVATLILVAGAWTFFTGDVLTGVLLGAILGGTSSAVIIPLVKMTSANEDAKTLLGLESALTDALCVIVAIAIAGVISILGSSSASSVSLIDIGGDILGAFSIAAVMGFVGGIIWLNLLRFFEKKPYEYLVTLAVLMFLYSVSQFFGGNGAIAALMFGIVLGNSLDLTSMLRLTPRKVESTIKSFQAEVSFIVRTFFFVYLGILFKPVYLEDIVVLLVAGLVLVAIIVSRLLGAKVVAMFNKELKREQTFMVLMNARGLAAASLMSFPAIVLLNLGLTFDRMTAIVFLVILATNIITSAGVFFFENKGKKSVIEEKPALVIKDY